MDPVLSRHELDQLRCEHGCDDHPLILHARCHMGAPTWAAYDRDTGHLVVTCAKCGHHVATVAVAATAATESADIEALLYEWAYLSDDPEDTRVLPWAKRAAHLLQTLRAQ